MIYPKKFVTTVSGAHTMCTSLACSSIHYVGWLSSIDLKDLIDYVYMHLATYYNVSLLTTLDMLFYDNKL